MGEEALPGREQADAARGAVEQASAELVLELTDLAGHRRLRDMQPPGRTTDVLLLGDGHEVADLGQAHAASVRIRGAEMQEVRAIRKWYWIAARVPVHLRRMSVTIYGPRELAAIERAGAAAAGTLAYVAERLRPGVTTAQIDAWVREDTARRGGRPSQLGYRGAGHKPFPASVCTSRNEIVCHGIPCDDVVLAEGDIINVDVTTELDGFHGDTSATFCVGAVSESARRLVETTRAARDAGIAAVRPGARLGDIGAAIAEVARRAGYGVVTDFGGHGIGRKMHEPPHVPHVGRAGTGLRLRPGMVFTIEPMLTLGTAEVELLADGWTVVTADRQWSAQFEHTVCVTESGARVLTAMC